jgi:hypothetical protein
MAGRGLAAPHHLAAAFLQPEGSQRARPRVIIFDGADDGYHGVRLSGDPPAA